MGSEYGIPYMGSKSGIAKQITEQLPAGKRFVDLFGGGFAVSHCALLSRKWDEVLYSDFNPLLPPLLRDAMDGKYDYAVFRPEWVGREDFFARKESDGYVKYVWSFGNYGKTYLFGADKEDAKRSIHNFVVFGIADDFVRGLDGVFEAVTASGVKARRLQFSGFMKRRQSRGLGSERLERLQQCERVERLQSMARLGRRAKSGLELRCADYRDYEWREGDVVYCDPPYEGTQDYGDDFDCAAFYEWAATRPYKVYISSYGVSDDRFYDVWQMPKRSLLCSTNNSKVVTERIYCNRDVEFTRQLSMF